MLLGISPPGLQVISSLRLDAFASWLGKQGVIAGSTHLPVPYKELRNLAFGLFLFLCSNYLNVGFLAFSKVTISHYSLFLQSHRIMDFELKEP